MIYLLVDVVLSSAWWVGKKVVGGVYYLAFGESETRSEKTNALLLIEMKQLRECVETLSKEVEGLKKDS